MTDREHYDVLMDVLMPPAALTGRDLASMMRTAVVSFVTCSVGAISAFIVLVRSYV